MLVFLELRTKFRIPSGKDGSPIQCFVFALKIRCPIAWHFVGCRCLTACAFYVNLHVVYMRAKPGKILSPRMAATIHSPSTLSATLRKQSRWIMKGAIRRSVDDMIEILSSGDRKATTFLLAELERLLDYHSWPDAWQARRAGDCQARHSGGAPLVWQGGGQ